MVSLGVRMARGVVQTTLVTPIVAGIGALGGYIYAKLADLPAGQVAKAFAVWYAIEGAILGISSAFTENKTTKSLIHATVTLVAGIVGIQELRKRGLLGDKMMFLMVAGRTIIVVVLLAHAAGLINLPDQVTNPQI